MCPGLCASALMGHQLIHSILLRSSHDNHAVPVVLAVRLLVRALPLDRDLVRRNAILVDQLLRNGSCTLLRLTHVVGRSTGLLVSITNNLDRSVVLLHELRCVVNIDLLVLIDLRAVQTEVNHVVYIVVDYLSNRRSALRTRTRTLAQLVVLSAQLVDLTVQVVQQSVIHRLQYLEVGLAQFEGQTCGQLNDTICQVIH